MSEQATRAAQQDADHQRWADDGGFTPDPHVPAATTRSPWVAVGVAAAIGFALGWLTGRRSSQSKPLTLGERDC